MRTIAVTMKHLVNVSIFVLLFFPAVLLGNSCPRLSFQNERGMAPSLLLSPGAFHSVAFGIELSNAGTGDDIASSKTAIAATKSAFEVKVTINDSVIFCEGDSVVLTAEAGYRSYLWSTGDTTRAIVVKQSGEYRVTAIDGTGLSGQSLPIRIQVNPLPVPDIIGPRDVCPHATATYSSAASGRATKWFVTGGAITGGTANSVAVQWGASGTGVVTLTETIDSSKCSGSTSINVRMGVNITPIISPIGNNPFCEGDSIILDAGTGYTKYNWSNGAKTRTITVRVTGAFTVSVEDAIGCAGLSDPYMVVVTPMPQPQIAGSPVACTGDTTYYETAFVAGHLYQWSVGEGAFIGSPAANRIAVIWNQIGVDTLRLTERDNATGCETETMRSIRIEETPRPVIIPNGPTICREGGTVTLSCEEPYSRYLWSNGDTTRDIIVSTGGKYFVTAWSPGGCAETSNEIVVTVRPYPLPDISGPQSACIGTTTLYSVVMDTSSTASWEATGGTIVSGAGTGAVSIQWGGAGVGAIIVTLRRDQCEASDTVLVSIGPSLQASITPIGSTSFCDGDSVVLDAGPGYASYEWRLPDGSRKTTQRITARTGGTYSVTIRDASGCRGDASIAMTMHPKPKPVITGPFSICANEKATLDAGAGYARYLWTLPDNSQDTSRRLEATMPGQYRVEVTNTQGCIAVSPVHALTVYPVPFEPVVTQKDDTLFAPPGYAFYRWYENSLEIPGADERFFVPDSEGVYIVRIVDGNGCAAQSQAFYYQMTQATLGFPIIEAAPGERVAIPLNMLSSYRLDRMKITDVTTTVRLNRHILIPVGKTPLGAIENDDRIITFSNAMPPFGDVIGELEFLAALGPVEKTPLHIDQVDWQGGNVNTTTIDGEFKLKVCREGGVRLFDGNGGVAIHGNNPNPFNASTIIEYEIIEAGRTRMTVADALGRIVTTLVDAELESGIYRIEFNASSLSSGVYYVTLQTPTVTRVRAVQVAK